MRWALFKEDGWGAIGMTGSCGSRLLGCIYGNSKISIVSGSYCRSPKHPE